VTLRRRQPVVALALIAWVLTIAPSLVAAAANQTFAPRYLYVPGAAVALAVGALAAQGGRVLRAGVAALIVGCALLAVIRVDAWDSAESLWSLEAERHPERPMALIHLGLVRERQGQSERALELQLAAIAAARRPPPKPRMLAQAHTHAARLTELEHRNVDAALDHLRRAVEANPLEARAWHATGVIHARDGAYDKAEQAFERAVTANPRRAAYLVALAGAVAAQQRPREALDLLERARDLCRNDPQQLAEIDRRAALISRLH
jgi:tetratricopeptide (TPR) repeat protein